MTAAFNRAAFACQLCAWFKQSQRPMPWRRPENARDPYRILVSEVMLQQTTVAAVAPLYEKFLLRFPTFQSLAQAPLDDVLSQWEGLGYYSRARNLHKAAQAVVANHGGEFPREVEQILALPGVGRYTAGAVASIAFDAPAPIVDANVARVFARVFCLEGDVKSPANARRLWHEAEKLVAACADADAKPSQFNPALMELGALICTPRAPRCELCPVSEFCAAFQANRQNELPHASPKRASIEQRDACAFARRTRAGREEILVRRRPPSARWWHGMWELPRTTAADGEATNAAIERFLGELGLKARAQTRFKTLHHAVTHHQIVLDCWSVEIDGPTDAPGVCWMTWPETETLAVPSTMRRLMIWLRAHPTGEAQMSLL